MPRVRSCHLLGVAKPLVFEQADAALVVHLPDRLPTKHASVIKVA